MYMLDAELWLPVTLEDVFPFFSDARNLEAITPSFLKFEVLTPGEINMKPGALIEYRLTVRGIPLKWRTEIAEWDPPHKFVDRQLKGPYKCWQHEHTFEPCDGGTLARDRVWYDMIGGAIVHGLFVGRDVRRIFAYRQAALMRHFGACDDERSRRSAKVRVVRLPAGSYPRAGIPAAGAQR